MRAWYKTEFWSIVGRPVGLERGLKGSTAKHTTAKQYSAALSRNPSLQQPAPPVPTLADRATGRARKMQEQHRTDVDVYTRLVEQARAEALLGKTAREQQSRALATLRGQVGGLQGAQVEVARLASENRKLVLELAHQKTKSDDRLAAVRALLEQASAKTKALMSEVDFWRREAETVRADQDDRRQMLSPANEPENPSARPGS